ncbi:MAG TPA: hypothetical protein VFR87_03750 [Nocardioidaceae bacterium]|nr:hypothetical protein [Nocardioidaceae bacterium]
MRRTMLVGLVLTLAAVVVVFVSAWLDLELEPVALMGVALGAVVALVPDRTPLMRLAGFGGGFVAAWIGYFVRAGMLPDSTGGRAVAVGLVIVLAVAVAAASMDRIPLWSTLLGAGAFAGAFEYTYAAAPPEVATTSVSAATALLLTAAAGYLATALIAPAGEQPVERAHRASTPRNDDETGRLDDMMMEKTK